MNKSKILIVDDDINMCELIKQDLSYRDMNSDFVLNGEEAFKKLQSNDYDVVLTDLNMPQMNGLELCKRIKDNWDDIPVIVLTAFGSMDMAIAALRVAAFDFVTKPIEMELLSLTLQKAVEHRNLTRKFHNLKEQVNFIEKLDDLIGDSPAMIELFEQIRLTAPTSANILIYGESGTGKELVAKALHNHGERKDSPFIALNCAAIPENLLESELFGHKKGTFTDATSSKKRPI
jgi:two-component system response regulator HydG